MGNKTLYYTVSDCFVVVVTNIFFLLLMLMMLSLTVFSPKALSKKGLWMTLSPLAQIDSVFYLVSTYLDIGQCGINNGVCPANANCQKTMGSISCTCKPGYIGNGLDCFSMKKFCTVAHIRSFLSFLS